MSYIKQILKSPLFILYVLAAVNIAVAYFYIKIPFAEGAGDSVTYYDAMRFWLGQKVESVFYTRLLTSPIMLVLSIGFSFLTGNLYWGMFAVNVVFYAIIIYVFYQLAATIYNDEKVAVYASVLFLANYAMYNWGTAFLVDMGGWLFFVLSSFFAVKYYLLQENLAGKKYFFFSVLAASVGCLFKEYSALGMVSLVTLIFISEKSWVQKIKETCLAGAVFIIVPFFYHLWFYLHYHYTYFNWYTTNYHLYLNNPNLAKNTYNLSTFIKVVGWIYNVGWPIFLLGLWQEKKFFNKERVKILVALSPASMMFLIWPGFTQRVAFIMVPWLALISGFGLSKIKNKYIILVALVFYVLINHNIQYLIKIINLPF